VSAGRRPGWRWPYSSSSRHCRSRRACTFWFASTAALVPALSRPALRTVLGSESAHPQFIGSSSVSCRSAVLRLLTRRRRPGSRHRLRRLLTSGCEHKQARDTAREGGRSRAQEQETVRICQTGRRAHQTPLAFRSRTSCPRRTTASKSGNEGAAQQATGTTGERDADLRTLPGQKQATGRAGQLSFYTSYTAAVEGGMSSTRRRAAQPGEAAGLSRGMPRGRRAQRRRHTLSRELVCTVKPI